MSEESTNPFDLITKFQAGFSADLDVVLQETGAAGEKDLTLPDNPVTVGGRVISADEWAKRQLEGSAAAGERWLYGVLHPKRHPVEAAIAANKKRKDRLAKAEQEEKWLKSMVRVDVDEMYKTIEAVGAAGYTAGVANREGKVKKRIAELRPMVEALALALDNMPQDTSAQREAKMIASKRGMEEIGRKRRGIA